MVEAKPSVREYQRILGRLKVSRKLVDILNSYTYGDIDRRIPNLVLKASCSLPTSDTVRAEIAGDIIPRAHDFAYNNVLTWRKAIPLLVYQEARRKRVDLTPQEAVTHFNAAGFKLGRFDLSRAKWWVMSLGLRPQEEALIGDVRSSQVAFRRFLPTKFPILRDLYEHVGLDALHDLRSQYRVEYEEKSASQQGRRPLNVAREALVDADRTVFLRLTRTLKRRARLYALEKYGAQFSLGEKRIVGVKGLVVDSVLRKN